MEKLQSIKQNSHFKRLYSKGTSLVLPCLVCYVRKNNVGKVRIGLTVSKKIGNAVKRNRAKRVLKVAARDAVKLGLKDTDLLLVARGKTPFVKSYRVSKELTEALKQASFLD